MKRLFSLLMLLTITVSVCMAQARRIESFPVTFKKAVVIGKGTEAAPGTSAWVEVGVDSSTRGAILYHMTDTTSVGARKVIGLMILNRLDTSMWLYNGKKWKKAGT